MQLNIFDLPKGSKKKPYEYDFVRYEGQKVKILSRDKEPREGIVTGFNHYYTFVVSKGEKLALTNKNCKPVNEKDYLL